MNGLLEVALSNLSSFSVSSAVALVLYGSVKKNCQLEANIKQNSNKIKKGE
ncbi:hypothetical protein FACS189454_09680 [Planctomycetales bacterium]|nr:hypothetical protein FACS189454_09680 [Planctomycetales bacterium]